jgi:hypothetical protein
MYYSSKYENGAPSTQGRVALERARHHCENHSAFSRRAFVDRHIDNGDVKMGHVSFLKKEKKICNPSSPLATTIWGKERSLSFN